jgi:hypothetical protein
MFGFEMYDCVGSGFSKASTCKSFSARKTHRHLKKALSSRIKLPSILGIESST